MSIKMAGQNGKVEILPGADIELDVVARIASKAALGVKGVHALENTFSDGIAAALGKYGRARGVRAIFEEGGCVFHISIVTNYGAIMPEVAWKLQEQVKNAVEDAIGIHVSRVNVLIAGIHKTGKKRLPGRPQ